MKSPGCLICGEKCEPVLTDLVDDRFGAPGTYDVVKCRSCGLEQTRPRPTERELKELYERFYGWGGVEGTAYGRLRQRFMASGLYRLWLNRDGDISFHLRQGSGRLLDVGCNEGRGLVLYAQNGFQVEGLEINERAAAAARKRGFSVSTVPLAEFAPERLYDVVVLSNVLEHSLDPVAMLMQVRRLLQPAESSGFPAPMAPAFGANYLDATGLTGMCPFISGISIPKL